MNILIQGTPTSLDDLRADIVAARAHGLSGQWAFTPETVEALIGKVEELKEVIEMEAARRANKAGLGVGEWEAFLSKDAALALGMTHEAAA